MQRMAPGRALRAAVEPILSLACLAALLALPACAPPRVVSNGDRRAAQAPSPDPRVGLRAGLFDAEEAAWNLRVVSKTLPPEAFAGAPNTDLAFSGPYVFQGNYNGIQIWDLSDPARPALVASHVCPASQSDVSVYRNLLFVSGEGFEGRLDCGTGGVPEAVSPVRLRGIRIFDISDIRSPRYIGNVQTCRGSHTHSLLVDPKDPEHVYVYVSGSAPVRPAEELAGCSGAAPGEDPNTALFRIEVIRVPLAHPEQAAIVSSPRFFEGLAAPRQHGLAPDDRAHVEQVRAAGGFIFDYQGQPNVLPDELVALLLDDVLKERGGSGPPTAADSTRLREALPTFIAARFGLQPGNEEGPGHGPTQCHDITLYPSLGLAGGACEGYGFLLDISDPVNPKRLEAVADTNFSYWHSATFNNDGTKILFTDEWGGGGQPKCRATDPKEWGADAIFTLAGGRMQFVDYYKLPAPQTPQENCVAHNGSLVPIPGRDVMAQSWYQGGISLFDWTDPSNPVEIAFHDRGPVNAEQMEGGGSWSVYWYNGVLVSSEIARGLDVFELVPSAFVSANEIAAAKTVTLDYFNAQGQPRFVWPATFALAQAYVDQLERAGGLPAKRIASLRRELSRAEGASGGGRRDRLAALAAALDDLAAGAADAPKVRTLADTVRSLASATP